MSRTMHRARGARRRRGSGFTLVEVSVAVGVLLVAILSAFSSQLTSLNLMHNSRETQVALGDLEAAMEEVRTIELLALPTSSKFAADVPVADFAGLHLQDEELVASYPGYVDGEPVPDPLTVVLTLTWSDYQGRSRGLTLTSMVTK